LPVHLPRTHRLSGYRGNAIPPRYARYPPGVSEDADDDGIHVGIFDTSAGRLAFVIDLRDIERLEQHLDLFLATMVIIGTAFSGWLGWLLAGAALAPVSRLADAVDSLSVQRRPSALQDMVSQDQLGRLAQAIDGYQARLVEADAHEQAFFADASHELRTPVAVVRGAIEVLLDDPANPALVSRLQRLERGVDELSDLLEAMLDIARRRPPQPEAVDARAFLAEAAASALARWPRLALRIDAAGTLQVAPREARLLLRDVLRRLLPHDPIGTLSLRLEPGVLSIAFEPAGDAATLPDDDAQRSDTGRVPALLERLAQVLGWQVGFPAGGHALVALQPSHTMWTSARA
jgi:signal transduction histidine kinase